jgi:hypothetical protein
MSPALEPFEISAPEEALKDLALRLRAARLPAIQPTSGTLGSARCTSAAPACQRPRRRRAARTDRSTTLPRTTTRSIAS